MSYYDVDLSDLVVIHDDLDFPLGRVRIREGGGSGGHNGMKSIIAHLGRKDFGRIRVGIAPRPMNGSLEAPQSGLPQRIRNPKYVLGHFNTLEKAIVTDVCYSVAEALKCILIEGIVAAMNRYNAG